MLGYNLYAYCSNNPINNFDEDGSIKIPNWVKTSAKNAWSWLSNAVKQDFNNTKQSAQNIYYWIVNLDKNARTSYANRMMNFPTKKYLSAADYKKQYDYYYNSGYDLYMGVCGFGMSKPSAPKVLSTSNAKSFVKSLGIKSVEAFKADWVGKNAVSKFDLVKDTKTGVIWLMDKAKKIFIDTGFKW